MSAALTPPFLVASLVLCLAGALKLRSPRTAAAALSVAPAIVRALAVGEVALGLVCAVHPTRAAAAALAGAYGVFAVVAWILKRRRAACGCFGEDDLPVMHSQVIATVLLGVLAGAAAVASPHGLGWLAGRPAGVGVVLGVGIAGAAYATVLVYTELPRAWAAWSGE